MAEERYFKVLLLFIYYIHLRELHKHILGPRLYTFLFHLLQVRQSLQKDTSIHNKHWSLMFWLRIPDLKRFTEFHHVNGAWKCHSIHCNINTSLGRNGNNRWTGGSPHSLWRPPPPPSLVCSLGGLFSENDGKRWSTVTHISPWGRKRGGSQRIILLAA